MYRDDEWRNNRHFLNPSKKKEYELCAMGYDWILPYNFLKDYTEKFSPFDPINQSEIDKMEKKSTIYLTRKEISQEEKELLDKNGFTLLKEWGTIILDLSKNVELDKNTLKNIRVGEKRLIFKKVETLEELKAYYDLFVNSRKKMNFKTPAWYHYGDIFTNTYYSAFIVKSIEDGSVQAGIGILGDNHFTSEINAARTNLYYVNDCLKYGLLQHLREKGVKYHDFAGCHPSPEEGSKDEGIRKYKAKWGGEYYKIYIYTR